MARKERIEPSKYVLKVDDLLLRLLKDYHNIDASEVSSFFGERASEMLACEPNITDRNKSPITMYIPGIKKTVTFTHRYNKSNTAYKADLRDINTNGNKVYVLRGFYPDTHLPFKMTLVQFNGQPTARGKVMIGLKDQHVSIEEKDVSVYNDAISESILLGTEIKEEDKIEYQYRLFKCMRPKGMKLYKEKKDGNK